MTGLRVGRLQKGDDLASTISLLVRFFREEGFDTPDEVIAANTRRMVELDTCGLFVAIAQNETIGVATVSLDFGIEFGWSAEMGDLYVTPDWRGKGVANLLVSAIEAYLASRGAAGYQVTVTPYAETHHGLARYYEKLGFESEGRLILYKKLAR